MTHEESNSGMMVAVLGGIGLILMVLVGGGVFLFWGRSRAAVTLVPASAGAPGTAPVPAAAAGNGVEIDAVDGRAVRTILRGAVAGASGELRAYWQQDGTADAQQSGYYEGELRLRELTAQELLELRSATH